MRRICPWARHIGNRDRPKNDSRFGEAYPYFRCQRSFFSRTDLGPSPSSQPLAAESSRSEASQKAVLKAKITR